MLFYWKTKESMASIIIQWNINRGEGNQLESNSYSVECNVILLENRGSNDIANHSLEYHQGRREAIGIQFIFHQMQ